ncbi:hypothetical protein K7X08_006184 [Anisodus acutangulus]|uniref:Uncharacterized protein n=1 Tax=Anisodus acutangulus TaxID=402998 RepID=A0A9Q1RNM9_9SOLA|nr:hypothetical protein K7X08_006184 [Anisodus acutangulus]
MKRTYNRGFKIHFRMGCCQRKKVSISTTHGYLRGPPLCTISGLKIVGEKTRGTPSGKHGMVRDFGYEEDKIRDAGEYIQEWNNHLIWGSGNIAKDRLRLGCNEDYKDWLRADLQGIVTPRINRYYHVQDIESKVEIKAYLI